MLFKEWGGGEQTLLKNCYNLHFIFVYKRLLWRVVHPWSPEQRIVNPPLPDILAANLYLAFNTNIIKRVPKGLCLQTLCNIVSGENVYKARQVETNRSTTKRFQFHLGRERKVGGNNVRAWVDDVSQRPSRERKSLSIQIVWVNVTTVWKSERSWRQACTHY